MSRDIESPIRPNLQEVPSAPAAEIHPKAMQSRDRETIELRGYRYQISPRMAATLREIGRFRTIRHDDLAQYQYQRRTSDMHDDLRSLSAQGLVQNRSVWTNSRSGHGKKLAVVVLTKTGLEVLKQGRHQGNSQKFFSGFVKPAEVQHDAAIYRMYQLEAERIRQVGGRIDRVVLDYELKQNVYAPLAKAKTLAPDDYARRQMEIAAQNNLKVVRGKILLPDLRIEYQSASGMNGHVDLELATDHYRGSHMRGKAEAGFKFYAPSEAVGRLASAFDPEHMAEIFSL